MRLPQLRRIPVVLLWTTALLASLFIVATARWFVWPDTDRPTQADAIIMYGGSGGRFPLARDLAEAGYAETLVVSDPRDEGAVWTAYGVFCDGNHRYEAICFEPDPKTTQGESRFVGELADERDWDHVVLVTDREQATRARMLLGRCFEGTIDVVTVPAQTSRLYRVSYEWGAWLRAMTTRRSC